MAIQFYMVGVMSSDMAKSRDFYRRLGLDFADGERSAPHAELRIHHDITFFLDTRLFTRDDGTPAKPGILIEFAMGDRATLDATYQDLIGAGYANYRAPFLSPVGIHFALVDDPDGNTVLLSTDTRP